MLRLVVRDFREGRDGRHTLVATAANDPRMEHADSLPDPRELLDTIDRLVEDVRRDADARCAAWPVLRADACDSARNLAAYLALRAHDLRGLQRALMLLGLSSLGRIESRVLPGLEAVRASLAALAGLPTSMRPDASTYFAGTTSLRERAASLLGRDSGSAVPGLLVTCPSEAAVDPEFIFGLAARGVDAIRINCAHDDAAAWTKMIEHVEIAHGLTGHRLRVFMDIAGPKIRTGAVSLPGDDYRAHDDDLIALARPGLLKEVAVAEGIAAAECTFEPVIDAAVAGEHVHYDDGKVELAVERKEAWGLLLRVVRAPANGAKLKREKALNFPDTRFEAPALNEKDLADLAFVAKHADGIEYSFVRSAEDVQALQKALAALCPDWERLWLILKIETLKAVERLPDILVHAAARQPTAVMIARGDLAVEIGFWRLAEMQEEILWIAEAAHVPTIWATEVLQSFVKKGVHSRGEVTDAAQAARAECIMLNKGPFVFEAIDALQDLTRRMSDHQQKKTPQLRRLESWSS